MTEVLSFLHSWIMLIVILMLQFYLVKRPQKWCSFVLPSIYFAQYLFCIINYKCSICYAGRRIHCR